MIKNSIRQLFRTKVKLILFFLLIILCALLICLGSNLVMQCQKNLEHFKEVFMTIGTVSQNPDSVYTEAIYDAGTKEYTYHNSNIYNKVMSLDCLSMDGVHYISKPERRPFYHVYLPDYKMLNDDAGWSNHIVVEASPEEDCIPSGPHKMKIKKVLSCIYELNVDFFYYCDHYTENPEKMYADRTYIMSLYDFVPHGFELGNPDGNPSEYIQTDGPATEQTTADGVLLQQNLPNKAVEEINDEFFSKGHDKYWDSYVKELDELYKTAPVTPTEDLNLIMAFYNGDAYIVDGERFTQEDYQEGRQKCLVSAQFARRNKLKIGDKLPLSFRAADYSYPPIIRWNSCLLTAEGKNFEPFYESDYTISGIYETRVGGDTDYGYTIADNEIFIPDTSIKADNADNIASWGGYISPYNTSFRIPNGTIDEFMKEWEKLGIKELTIHFYDKGYSKLEDGILQMERMAYILLFGGIIMAVLVVIFFSHMMIGGQKRRTAIERSLGQSKKNCMISLMSGILIVAAIGCMIGCLTGLVLTNRVANKMTDQKVFDQRYSAETVNGQESDDNKKDTENESLLQNIVPVQENYQLTLVVFIGLFSFILVVSGFSAWNNLKEEPLALLSAKVN